MSAGARRERVRAIIGSAGCVRPASVFDPISARIAEDLGYETGMLGGSVASMAVTGAPDLLVLTLTELAEQLRRITRASELPLLVDADHGFGNALNVMRTVEELEAAGAAALTIEDTELPPVYGRPRGERLIPLEEGEAKIRAALAARREPGLVVIARTSAAAATGLQDVIERGLAYRRAGADALFVRGLKSRLELEAVAASVGLPLMIDGGNRALRDPVWLAGAGVRIQLQGHQPFAAAVKAVHDTLKAQRDGAAPDALAGLAPPALMKAVTRAADYDRMIAEFLGG